MSQFATKTDSEIDSWIANHEARKAITSPLYNDLLEERARRVQLHQSLNLECSIKHLKLAAIGQKFTTYGDLARASGVEWSKARPQMNGPRGHLDRLLELCYARKLPMLTAICVNRDGLDEGKLGPDALAGFVACARRVGFVVTNEGAFHRQCKDECFRWGQQQNAGRH